MIWGLIASFAKGLVSPVTEIVGNYQKRKRVKLEGDIAIARAQTNSLVKRLETEQAGDIAWQNLSIKNSSWKDEWFTVILSIPAILCFVPGMVQFVEQGFAALQLCPDWYRWAFLVAVSASFGYKKLADLMKLRKGV